MFSMNVWKTRHYTSDRGGQPTANSKSGVQRQQRTDDQVIWVGNAAQEVGNDWQSVVAVYTGDVRGWRNTISHVLRGFVLLKPAPVSRVNTLPVVSTTACERGFSKTNIVHSPYRTRLTVSISIYITIRTTTGQVASRSLCKDMDGMLETGTMQIATVAVDVLRKLALRYKIMSLWSMF